MELSNEIKDKIVNIINATNGRNIGTGLQCDLEEAINSILPSNLKYEFSFNMSGITSHLIFDKNTNEEIRF